MIVDNGRSQVLGSEFPPDAALPSAGAWQTPVRRTRHIGGRGYSSLSIPAYRRGDFSTLLQWHLKILKISAVRLFFVHGL